MNRDEMKSELLSNVCNVVFTKADGSERHMRCTLNPLLIPSNPLVKLTKTSDETRVENLDVLRVFDLEKEDCRSFRVDSVKQFSAEQNHQQAS